MSYINLGHKSNMGGKVATEASSEPSVSYPSFHIDTAEAVDMKADEVVEVKVRLRFKGFRKETYGDKSKPFCNDFDVMAIDFGDKKNPKKGAAEELEEAVGADLKEMSRD